MSPLQIIIIVLAAANLLSFALVGLDKRKSFGGERRIPEVYFFFWSIFFSSLGVLVGMVLFHHKTRKWTFIIGITLLFLEQLALAYLYLTKIILQ